MKIEDDVESSAPEAEIVTVPHVGPLPLKVRLRQLLDRKITIS
jgi:hypothetical protein